MLFEQLVGSMLHRADKVRPNIAFAASYLFHFMHWPMQMVQKSERCLEWYISGSKGLDNVYCDDETVICFVIETGRLQNECAVVFCDGRAMVLQI